MTVEIEIQGIEEVSRKMDQMAEDIQGTPMEMGMRDATMLVTRQARINAPVDTGRLRASIAPEVRQQGRTVQGIVGSNVRYAPFQEYGTDRTPGKRYLQRAFEDNIEKIKALIGDVVARIVRK